MPRFEIQYEERRYACSVLLPHALVAVSYEAKRLDCRSRLLLNISKYESEIGRFHDSHQHAVQTFEAALDAHGDLSVETFHIKTQISITLLKLGKYDESFKLLHEIMGNTIPIDELMKDMEDLGKARSSSLKSLTLRQGNAGFAAIQQALDQHRACHGMPSMIQFLVGLALAAHVEGKSEESENMYRQVLQKSTEFYGENHPETFSHMDMLAGHLMRTEKTAEAVQLFRQATLGRQSFFGMENPLTMQSRVNLADALCFEDNFVEAEVVGSGTLEYYLRTFGLEHDHAVKALGVYMRIIIGGGVGNINEANELLRLHSLSEDNVSAEVTSTLVSSYLARGNPLEAEQILCKGVEDLQERGGQENPEISLLWENLAECLEKQGKLEAAEGYCRRSLELYDRAQGENFEGIKRCLSSLSSILEKQVDLRPDKKQKYYELVVRKFRMGLI